MKELLENESKYYRDLSKTQEEEINTLMKENKRLNNIIENTIKYIEKLKTNAPDEIALNKLINILEGEDENE